jgi:hypothetical protein
MNKLLIQKEMQKERQQNFFQYLKLLIKNKNSLESAIENFKNVFQNENVFSYVKQEEITFLRDIKYEPTSTRINPSFAFLARLEKNKSTYSPSDKFYNILKENYLVFGTYKDNIINYMNITLNYVINEILESFENQNIKDFKKKEKLSHYIEQNTHLDLQVKIDDLVTAIESDPLYFMDLNLHQKPKKANEYGLKLIFDPKKEFIDYSINGLKGINSKLTLDFPCLITANGDHKPKLTPTK